MTTCMSRLWSDLASVWRLGHCARLSAGIPSHRVRYQTTLPLVGIRQKEAEDVHVVFNWKDTQASSKAKEN